MSSSLLLAAGAVVLLASAPHIAEGAAKLPSNFKRCAVSDRQLNECMRGAVEDAFRKMKDGISNLGVFPVDPLKVDEIKIDQGGSSSVNMKIDLMNITMYGLSETKIVNYSAILDEGVLRTESLTPVLKMDFTHKMGGRILLLPIQGAGPGSITMGDLVTYHYLKFVPKTKKDGKIYWSMTNYEVQFVPKRISMDFKGLYGGDGRLSDTLNTFLNQNSRLIFDEIKGSIQEAFGAVFKEITSRLFNKVPFDDIFVTGNGA